MSDQVTILVVDDEVSIRRALQDILSFESYQVRDAAGGRDALSIVARERVDLVLLDIKMPEMDGLEVLDALQSTHPGLPVIMLSGHGSIETAVDATRRGATDFIEKPPDLNRLLISIRNALARRGLEQSNDTLREAVQGEAARRLTPMLGQHASITQIRETIRRVAPTEARVLITGEPGTGKELVARWIHAQSRRADHPLIEVNCAAIPGELIESELFGYEKGAFTGANRQRSGLFEQASGGTLFLDEIGELSSAAQAKLLRVLQEGRVARLGGDRLIEVDVRIIAATNRDLNEMMAAGTFRADLYHRIGVIPITVPPLRARRSDVPILVAELAPRIARRNGVSASTFSDGALTMLAAQAWPGNIRELINVLERLLILADGPEISEQAVRSALYPAGADEAATMQTTPDLIATTRTFSAFRDEAEAAFLAAQLQLFGWNVTKTAEALEMPRSHLYTKIKRYGLTREDDN